MVDNVQTDTGIHLPKGTIFSFLGQPAQMDEENYQEPLKFDPFRFSRSEDASSSTKEKRSTFVTTAPHHLPFGHGKHACPGRFLIDFELKMIIAYIVANYELRFPEEYGDTRPPNKWLMEVSLPPNGVQLLVKRRRGMGQHRA
jgi:cytochrome P450